MRRRRFPIQWLQAAAIPALCGLCGQHAVADTFSWQPPLSGGGGSALWANTSNWSLSTVPGASDVALFNQTTFNFQPNAGATSVGGIVIGDGATTVAAVSFTGTSLTLGASGFTKNANTAAVTFTTPMTFAASQTWTNNSATLLTVVGANQVTLGANALTVAGSGNINFQGILSGTGASIVKTGAGTLTVASSGGSNSYTGGVFIKQGAVVTGGGNAGISAASMGTGAINLGDSNTNADATLTIAGTAVIISNALVVNSVSSGTLTLASASGTYNGSVTLNNDLVVNASGAGQFTFAVPSTSTGITGSKDLIINSTGTSFVLFDGSTGSGNPNWTGNLRIKAGQLRLANGSLLRPVLSAANTVSIGAAGTLDYRNTANLVIAGLNNDGGTGGVITNSSGGIGTINLGGNGTYSFAGGLNGSTNSLALNVMLGSSGVQTLSGVSNYSGTTTINSGVLDVKTLTTSGLASSIGLSGSGAANLILTGGTLRYSGSGNTTDRLFSITAAGATIDASGSGLIDFNNVNAITVSDAAVRNVTTGVSTTFTGIANVGELVVGMSVTGPNIQGGTTITSVNVPSQSFSISQAPIASGATSVTFGTLNRSLTLTGSGQGSMSPILVDSAGAKLSLVKSGSDTWTLKGTNTYTGGTTITAGKLVVGVSGSGSLTSAVVVNAGTLSGSGSTTSTVNIGDGAGGHDAVVDPGNSAGTFTASGSLTLAADATYRFEINSTTASVAADKIVANGVTIDGAALLSFNDLGDGTGVAIGNTFTIIDNTAEGNIAGTFANLANGGYIVSNGVNYQASYGNDLVLTAVAETPEPASIGLIGIGAVGLLSRRRRRSRVE